MKKAVVLLSGGLDSSTVLAHAINQGFECTALSFNYGQRHQAEMEAASRVAKSLGVKDHRLVSLDLSKFGGSALTDTELSVPDHTDDEHIPITYVPARNTIFLSIALGLAEVLESRDIFIGVSSVDYSHYPDCRPEFIKSFEQLSNLATKAGVEGDSFHIHAPLQHLTKAETLLLGNKLGVDYRLTVSCYQANEKGQACGRCDSCMLRKKGFQDAGLEDCTSYL